MQESLEDERESQGDDSLPELSVRSIGMHIGGGENTPAEKKPWLLDLEQAEGAVLSCQKYARKPLEPGVIRLEYLVGKEGGAAEIRSVSQRIGDEKYAACVRDAYQQVVFHRPKVPTVVSCAFLVSWQGLPEEEKR